MFEIKNLNIEQTVRDCKGLKRDKNSIIHFLKKITVKCLTIVNPYYSTDRKRYHFLKPKYYAFFLSRFYHSLFSK